MQERQHLAVLAEPPEESLGVPVAPAETGVLDRILATPNDLPHCSHTVVQTLFVLLHMMYLGFYVGALSNLAEINDLFSQLSIPGWAFSVVIVSAVLLIPVRTFLLCAVLFHAPRTREKFQRIWLGLLLFDALWALARFLLLHHINYGLAMACVTPLVYSPFAQRSLILMGAGSIARAS